MHALQPICNTIVSFIRLIVGDNYSVLLSEENYVTTRKECKLPETRQPTFAWRLSYYNYYFYIRSKLCVPFKSCTFIVKFNIVNLNHTIWWFNGVDLFELFLNMLYREMQV